MKVQNLSLTVPLLLISILLSGCLQPKTVKLSSSFNPEKAKVKPGSNTIKGNALIRQQKGSVVNCGGYKALLVPVTPYSTERIKHIYSSTQKGFNSVQSRQIKFKPRNKKYFDSMKTTTCDSQGKFEFENIADGEYYVITTVVWKIGEVKQGGTLMKRVEISEGETQEIVLSP